MDKKSEKEIEEAVKASLNRRDFLKASGLIAAGLAISPALLAACTSSSNKSNSSEKSIHISNWPTYIGDSQKTGFEKATGIKLTYTEDINDNDEYFAKISPLLNKDKSISRDGFVLTDWMANRIINQVEWAQPLSQKKLTNRDNLVEALASPSFDKTRKFSMPWASIIAGIAYNIKLTGKEIKTFDDFLDVPGSKTVLSEMRDTIGIMLMDANVKLEDATTAQITTQFDRLQELIDSKKIDGINGNDYITDLSSGNLAACFAWAGDASQLTIDNPDIRFVIPESGGTLSSDNFMIPISSDKPDQATEFINYFYDPAVSAQWVADVQYISPVQGVADELTKLGGDAAKLVDNPLTVPDEETLAQLQIFPSLDEKAEEKFADQTSEVVGAG